MISREITPDSRAGASASSGLILLSVAQAANVIGMSASWLNKKRVVGGGPTYMKLGRRVVYDRTDVAAWVAAHRRNNTSEQ
jgi:predicted DNA-binding transcriptional regulator AlpA